MKNILWDKIRKLEVNLFNNNYIINLFEFNDKTIIKLVKIIKRYKIDSVVFSKDIDKEYKSHEISIKNEEDRLEIKGRFKRGVEVKAILYKNGIIKEYNIPISKKPYTAMCVDIFTEEENKNGIVVTKYINKEDLSGKYSLYLQMNDTIYKTGKYIEE